MTDPSFSVIVPTYQRRDVVCDTVRALSASNYKGPVELIVVVDGSTDGTAGALAQLDCALPMRVIEQDNHGAAAARNRGAAEAKGDVLLFLDDDMIAEPDLIEQHARMYGEGADAVFGQTPHHPDSPPGFLSDSVARWIATEHVRSPISPFDVFSGQLSVRRSVFDEVGGFDEAFTTGSAFANEDADLGVRLLSRFKVQYNPSAISRQRYVVGPREYIGRASKLVEGDLHFLTKNPQFSRQVLGDRGQSSWLGRFIYIPLSRIPFVPPILSSVAAHAAEIVLKTPFRSSRLFSRFFSGSFSVAYWAAMRKKCADPRRGRLLVLCYHAIRDLSDDPLLSPYGVVPRALAEQLDYLKSAGFSFVSPDAAANFLDHGAPLPRRAVLLTFDDCYEELLEIARDVLQARGIQAIAFAVTAMRSTTNEWDQAYGARRLKLLTGKQLSQLGAYGIEIGSHSRTHREMPLLNVSEQESEASGSADDFVAHGLPRPRFFAYPFGAADESSRAAVRRAGYRAAFGCEPSYVNSGSDRLNLPRVLVYSSDRGWRFRFKSSAPRLFSNLAWLYQAVRNRLRKVGRRQSGIKQDMARAA